MSTGAAHLNSQTLFPGAAPVHLLQICNVGNICGGTAACAWTITRSLPSWRHGVWFLSRPNDPTRAAFAGCEIESGPLSRDRLHGLSPDIILLHNIGAARWPGGDAPLIVQYLHSRIAPAAADVTVACSHWLAACYPGGVVDEVLYQPAPRPPRISGGDVRPLRQYPVVGRICTPAPHKWPAGLIPFYTRLAAAHPEVDWEFVGAPQAMRSSLAAACGGRARFHEAGWEARSHLWRWDALLYHHPSLTESFGRIVAESLAAGCIPIVDDRGGFREQVTPDTGRLCAGFEEFDAALLALRSAAWRRQLSRASQAAACERFTPARFAQDFCDLVARTCQRLP